MAFFSFQELLDLVIMIGAVAFIFKDSFMRQERRDYEPLDHYAGKKHFNLEHIKFAIIATAPAIALHEMGHKLVAILMGIPATFHASYFWLAIGIVLKALSFPFIFFVPGYVSHGMAPPLTLAIIAFAGPFVNLVLWLGSEGLIRTSFGKKHHALLYATKQINMFLFIFNMIPIPPFDGGTVFGSLIQLLGPGI